MTCSSDSRIGPLVSGVTHATADRSAASARLASASAARAAIDRTVAASALRAATSSYQEAVQNSQLHSFAAMVFGKEPTDVTDGEIAQFLRVFVFVPAIGSAFAATLIALMAVNRIKPPPEPVDLADEAASYILEPFAAAIIREATTAATQAAQDSIAKAHDAANARPSFAQA